MANPENTPTAQGASPASTLLRMLAGQRVAQAIYVAAELGIADLLKDGPKSAEALAQATQVDSRSLYRVLRALASVGVFAELADQQFELTPMAGCLRSDAPDSVRAIAIMFGQPWHRQPWNDILHSVKTGDPAFDHVFGVDVFSYFTQHPQASQIFNQAMSSFSSIEKHNVLAAYDFSAIETLIDIAGGHGSLLSAILSAHPHMQGILFDLPGVIAGAQPQIEAAGLGDRCQLIGGDFFESVPRGGDAYLLKHIIHDWDDQRAIAILQNCRQAMPETGKLLLIEGVIAPGNQPSWSKLGDLEMLIMTSGGRERTEAEYADLYAAAGFKLTQVIATNSPASILEGIPL